MDQVARTVLGLLLLAAVACVVPLVDGVRQTRAVLWAATLPDDGPSGELRRDGQPLAW